MQQAVQRPAQEEPLPKEDRSRGLVYRGLEVDTQECPGGYEVAESGSCSHGPDAPPAGYRMGVPVAAVSTDTPAEAVPATCSGDGVSGNRVQVLYVHGPGTDRFAEYKASFEEWANGIDVIFDESAKETGGSRHVRFVHNASCTPVVENVAISDAALGDFGQMESALQSQGHNRRDRKYVVFAESNVYCGIGGFAGDTSTGAGNASNFGPSFGRTDTSCWGASTAAHELGHNLGAVNNNAPNTSGGAHCTDEYDVMCYSDSPNYPTMRYVCADSGHDDRLDCNHDDYYHTDPPAGSYLATNWNMADSAFLDIGGTTDPDPDPDPNPDPDPDPDPSFCNDRLEMFTGSLETGQRAVQPNGSYYSSGAGNQVACIDGPEGSDFDIYLRKWSGSAWVTVASATSEATNDVMTYAGTAGFYYYWVEAYSGSGAYTLGIERP